MAKIKGYRELSPDEVELINDIKKIANDVGRLINIMKDYSSFDQRWLSIGETGLQQGFMALVRAVAKPEGF